ncbi:hypothetical protein HQQ81_02380 [Microbacteriaceae bacterium VKM Ac-2854]|nr:hypothetical protein [Microbacteriaceae bacterium VKM Ac-2854]
MRRRAAAALGAPLVIALSACAPLDPLCTEIGYRNSLSVTVTDVRVADIALCAADICAADPDAAPQGRSYWVIHNVPGLWLFDFGSDLPESAQFTLTASDGTVLDDRERAIDWTLLDEPNGAGCGWRAGPAELAIELE